MKNVIIVSKCTKISNYSESENNYSFHFKGVFAGDLLKEVILRGSKDLNVKVDEEYLIYVQIVALEKNTLHGKILKIKNLTECWEKEVQS
jgi:hypothetical protein